MAISRKDLLKQIEGMSPRDLAELGDTLHALANRKNGGKTRRITELKGLGKEVWKGVDIDAYLDEERDSWQR